MTKKDIVMEAKDKDLTSDQLCVILQLITNQRFFRYNMIDLVKSALYCVPCRSDKSLKKSKVGRKDLHFKTGVAKLEKDLDVLNLLAMMKLFRSLRHVLFTKEQSLFLKF